MLIIGILTALDVLYSFWENPEYGIFFGFEINIWIYRLIWAGVAFILLYDYFKKKKINE